MDNLRQDIRFAIRSFLKAPGFTLLALLTLGIGIGVNATVFSFVNALLLRPAPGIREPGRLVSVFTSDFSSGPYGSSSYPDFVSIKSGASAFSALAASSGGPAALMRVGNGIERIRTLNVSGDYFTAIGVQPIAGRAISAADVAAKAPVAVIGYHLWQRGFGGAATAVGTEITIDGRPVSVIGIAPERFTGVDLGATIEVWTPLEDRSDPRQRRNRGLSIVGRLANGVSLGQAQAQLDGIAVRLAAEFPQSNRGTLKNPDDARPMTVVPHTRLHPRFRREVAMIGSVLVATVALVLLIACANVAGLLLSRATARTREVSVRLALGASRRRILRQMLTESLLLAAAGAAIGLLFALWTADALPSFFPAEQRLLLDARIDWTVVSFTAAAALGSGLLFGLAPAFHGLRSPLAGALRSDGRAGDARRTVNMRNLLVMAQVAMASVLLVAAVLLTRSLWLAGSADPGFSTRNAVLLSIELPSAMTEAGGLAYYQRLLETVSALPGIEHAGLARVVPVAGGSRTVFEVPGYVPREGEDMELNINTVDAGYFATLGVSPMAGRLFQAADAPDAPIVVVNDVFARRYYAGDAVGRRIRTPNGPDLEIVGVVPLQPRDGLQEQSLPVVFVRLGLDFTSRAILVARTAGDPAPLLDTVRRAAAGVDESVAVFRPITLDDHLAEAVAGNRLTASMVATCGLMAFILAVVGIYGVIAYAVGRRTREIGVRIALGARPSQVMALVALEGGRIIGIGVIAGVLGAFGSTRLLSSMLYGVTATDIATFVIVPLTVAVMAMLATCVPAARALRISPVAALRHD